MNSKSNEKSTENVYLPVRDIEQTMVAKLY